MNFHYKWKLANGEKTAAFRDCKQGQLACFCSIVYTYEKG